MSSEPIARTVSHGEELSALIVGSGFGGLCMAIRLQQAGIDDFVILERGAAIGGTWRDNDYPGCACDVQSHLYSFSFEPNPSWTRMFAPQKEIQAYLERCVEKYALRGKLRLGESADRADYDEASGTWTVRSGKGNVYRTRTLVSAIGAFSKPAYPKVPGIERFEGKKFHSAHWDHDYDLSGKRVAVIGTGASAIQFVPQIQKQVAQLHLFQRTPPWIMPKPDRATGKTERELYTALPWTQRLFRTLIYWMLEGRVLGFVNPKLMQAASTQALRHIRKQISDPVLRRKVTPDYTMGCKRVLISNDYYPALTQPNVDVITDDVAEIRAHSVVTADGREHEVDVIIFGTGFEVQQMLPAGMLFGKDGKDITASWEGRGPQAYKGTSISGFPNLFLILGPNTGLGHSSVIFMIESQVSYILQAIQGMLRNDWRSVDVKPEAQRAFNERLDRKHKGAVWLSGCKSWYLDASGRNTTLWPGFTFAFRRILARFDTGAYAIATRDAHAVTAQTATDSVAMKARNAA